MSQTELDKSKEMDITNLFDDVNNPTSLFDSSSDTSVSLTTSVSPLQRSGYSEDQSGCGNESANRGEETLGQESERRVDSQGTSQSLDDPLTPGQPSHQATHPYPAAPTLPVDG